MPIAHELANRLENVGLEISSARRIDYCDQIRLVCGAIINVFDTGTITVQGKLDLRGKAQRVALLRQVLPSNTRFMASMVPKVPTKSLVRGPDGYFVDGEGNWNTEHGGPGLDWSASQSAQSRMVQALPISMGIENDEYVHEELRQVRDDTGEPYERW